jgi:hypothetical protein
MVDAGNTSNFFLDLSKATSLESLTFRSWAIDVEWVIRTLNSVQGNHKKIKIRVIYDIIHVQGPAGGLKFADAVGATVLEQWLRLDGLIVKLWESSKIPTKVFCHNLYGGWQSWRVEEATKTLLPEATRRGVVKVEEFHHRLWLDLD